MVCSVVSRDFEAVQPSISIVLEVSGSILLLLVASYPTVHFVLVLSNLELQELELLSCLCALIYMMHLICRRYSVGFVLAFW